MIAVEPLTRRAALRLLGGALAYSKNARCVTNASKNVSGTIHCVPLQNGPQGAGLYVFRHTMTEREFLGFEPVRDFSAATVSQSGRVIFVTTASADEDPRSAYVLHSYALSDHGSVALLSSRRLTLFAAHPEAVSSSPCGRRVAVLAGERSVFNVFEVEADGSLSNLAFVHRDITLKKATQGLEPDQAQLRFQDDGSLQYKVDSMGLQVKYVLKDGTLVRVSRRLRHS